MIDHEKIEQAVRLLLEGIGEDVNREGLLCMTMRGIKKPGSQTVTLARRGVFETDPSLEERFFRMLGR